MHQFIYLFIYSYNYLFIPLIFKYFCILLLFTYEFPCFFYYLCTIYVFIYIFIQSFLYRFCYRLL